LDYYLPVEPSVRDLAIFPLNTVLFPGMPLPLHIFEPRYRQMIGQCLAADREFGVSLIKEGVEVGGSAEPFGVGTVCRITDVERLPDGRMNLMTMGLGRFRIESIVEHLPFLVGRTTPLDEDVEPVDPTLVETVKRRFDQLVTLLRGEGSPAFELPDDPGAMSFRVAGVMPIAAVQRQALLEITSTNERLERLAASLRREHQTALLFSRAGEMKSSGPFSNN
jgi:Lon protease-like protein